MERSQPVRPGAARNEAQMGAGLAQTARAARMRSPTDAPVWWCNSRHASGTSKWKRHGGLTRRRLRGKDALGTGSAVGIFMARMEAGEGRGRGGGRSFLAPGTLREGAQSQHAEQSGGVGHGLHGAEPRSRITFAISGNLVVTWAKQKQEAGEPMEELLTSSDPKRDQGRNPHSLAGSSSSRQSSTSAPWLAQFLGSTKRRSPDQGVRPQ